MAPAEPPSMVSAYIRSDENRALPPDPRSQLARLVQPLPRDAEVGEGGGYAVVWPDIMAPSRFRSSTRARVRRVCPAPAREARPGRSRRGLARHSAISARAACIQAAIFW
jgi:hypothetical protein